MPNSTATGLHGIVVPILTPVQPDGQVDLLC